MSLQRYEEIMDIKSNICIHINMVAGFCTECGRTGERKAGIGWRGHGNRRWYHRLLDPVSGTG